MRHILIAYKPLSVIRYANESVDEVATSSSPSFSFCENSAAKG
jgi:hypothetical protein